MSEIFWRDNNAQFLGTVRSIIDDWERSIKEAKVRIGL
jgi:hypothetical protein